MAGDMKGTGRIPRGSHRCPMLLGALISGTLAGCGGPGAFPNPTFREATLSVQALQQERAAAIDREVSSVLPQVSRDNRAQLHIDGANGFGAIRRLIRAARKSIWFETFIWHYDETGIEIAQLLRKRALEGLDVRVLVDAAGTLDKAPDRQVLRILEDRRVPVKYFNPFILRGGNVHVTHRKLYLADGHRAITGGMNLGREYEKDWHDLLVEVEGPVARQLHAHFAAGWKHSRDGPEEDLIIPSPPPLASGSVSARVAVTSPFAKEGRLTEIKQAHWAAIRAARRHIRVFHVYMSDPQFVRELQNAIARGTRVEILIPQENDVTAFRYINRHFGGKLVDSGAQVKIFPTRFSHVKYLSVDGVWISLGSANADSRSFYENEELNVLITNSAFVGEADRRVFEKDWAESREPTYADLHVPLVWKPVVTLAQILSYYL